MTVTNAKSITTSQREVARPMANLGNTCYMNAVLQALAHSPELCYAIDREPHSVNCPVELENRRRYKNSKQQRSSPSSSPENSSNGNATDSSSEDSWRQHLSRRIEKAPTRKSRRGKAAAVSNSNGVDEFKFCTLCEVEHHLGMVHSQKSSASTNTTRRGAKSKDKPVSPITFVHGFINNVAPWFKLGLQEDSHEFLRLLIDAMQKSCKDARESSSKSQDHNNDSGNTGDCENPQDSASSLKDTSSSVNNSNTEHKERDHDIEYPFQLFRGTVESNVTCDSCKASSSTMDPIEDVGLEVTTMSSNSSSADAVLADVSSAFQRFTRLEELDAGYKCEKCGKLGSATKQSRLASIPPILTLHLKRFRYGANTGASTNGFRTNNNGGTSLSRPARRSSEVSQLLRNSGNLSEYHYTGKSGSAKIEGHIKFDMVIDLKPYLTMQLQKEHSSVLCRLFAVVVHAGKNSHSGHYVTYVCNVKNKNEWWKMDDARVTMVSLEEVMSAEAYMLFYRVVDHPISVNLKKSKIEQGSEVGKKTAATVTTKTKTAQDEGNAPPATVDEKLETATSKGRQKRIKASSSSPSVVSQASSPPQSPAPEANNNSVDSSYSKRKRNKKPEFENGESWARAKTRLGDFSDITKVEKYISEHVDLTQAFFKLINEEASKADAKVGNGPNTVICADDIVGGFKKLEPGIREFLYHVVTRFEEEKGEPFFLPDSARKKPRFEKKLFEVVEASDDNLL